MHQNTHYSTVADAINQLRLKGFTTDFNLIDNCLICNSEIFKHEDLEIVDVYRYEGDSDPSDEAVVYAIASKSGIKGLLVDGFGASSNPKIAEILKGIKMRK